MSDENLPQLLASIENEIDRDFSSNPLIYEPRDVAIKSILVALEYRYVKLMSSKDITAERMRSYVDTVVNYAKHPIAVCHSRCAIVHGSRLPLGIYHLKSANAWFEQSFQYNFFCSAFSLWHKGAIELHVIGDRIQRVGGDKISAAYEAYNRVVYKHGDTDSHGVESSPPFPRVASRTGANGWKKEIIDKKTIRAVMRSVRMEYERIQKIPGDWTVGGIKFRDFNEVMLALTAMAKIRIDNTIASTRNGPGFIPTDDSIIITTKRNLIKELSVYSQIDRHNVGLIIERLIYGSNGIRSPDVALQPIIQLDTTDNYIAVSPFLMCNLDFERNYCAVINQFGSLRGEYSILSSKKESEMKMYFEDICRRWNGDVRIASGVIDETDIDACVIDDKNKTALTIEFKWFIEPAEIREVLDRSQELEKGVAQCMKILNQFKNGNKRLCELLGIDRSYSMHAVVASRTWVGMDDVQNKDIPIIKFDHLAELMKAGVTFCGLIEWLMTRRYITEIEGRYEVVTVPCAVGKWKMDWYGIKHI